ncbi:MAG: vitamin B12-dependent ribonucleotide reductase [Candidatus Saganbacteria bacterium]|nr:vitamin B12-dependent ribonucleotide reductase [Candidatus Saganbacteria bacterium]
MLRNIRKRDRKLAKFDQSKIEDAIRKAFVAVGERDGKNVKILTEAVTSRLGKRYPKAIPDVENIQDIVEAVLIDHGFAEAAKAYILYRKRRAEIREAKKFIGVADDLKLSVNALQVLARRYLLKDENGNIVETPKALMQRIARTIAKADRKYDKNADIRKTEEEFFKMLASLEFLPNSPTLMNAGTDIGQLSACFVIPVEDSVPSIFDSIKDMALIQQSGGGTGFSFSRLRPKGDIVKTTRGVASGPVSFISVFDLATDVIKQGGRRRGANMGILSVDHPDIIEFIGAKGKEGFLSNFNISVSCTDKFMRAVQQNKEYELVNPRTKKPVKKLRAKDVFDLIITMAWRTGDPGMVFIDEINRSNPTPKIGKIESTNPCGEQPLLPYESCNLGSINLVKMVKAGELDFKKLEQTVRTAVHFLDNAIDANKYPLRETEKITKANRKIGLGVMGFAEMLIALGIPYDSNNALKLGERIMAFISSIGRKTSVELAKKRGSFPNFKGSIWQRKGYKAFRNATITTIAPTGSISIIADCTSGIEPLFAVSFIRDVLEGTKLLEANPMFEKMAMENGFYKTELMYKVAQTGIVKGLKDIPLKVRRLFITALEIPPEWHVRMQAVFQKHTDNAVSKTVNLPEGSTIADVRKAYLLAHKLKCKGITIYRYGSKREQVLYRGTFKSKKTAEHVSAGSEYSGGCPTSYCPY